MRLFRKRQKMQRRARPLSGHSLSANSYYRPVSQPLQATKKTHDNKSATSQRPDSTKHKQRRFSLTKTLNILISLVFVVLMFFATTLSSSVDIKLPDSSYSYRSMIEYERAAADILHAGLLTRSKLLFRSAQFEAAFLEAFPEISSVEAIVPIGGRNLTVGIQVSEPLAIVQNGADYAVIDTNGVLVNTWDPQSRADLFTIRYTAPQGNFEVGSRQLTSDEVRIVALLKQELAAQTDLHEDGLHISEILFTIRDGIFEVRLNEVPYTLRLSSYAEAEEQVGAALVTMRELTAQNQLPSKYIDVRVPGRVYVL